MKLVVVMLMVTLTARAQITNNVLDWGASGDGVTQDQDAFNSAITNLYAQGGGVLWIPDGTYILHRAASTAALNLTSITNIHFRGESRAGTILKLEPAGGYGTNSDAHIIRLANSDDWSFMDLTMDGSRTNYLWHDEQMHGLYLLNAGPIHVERVTFQNMRGDGIFSVGDDVLSCPEAPCFTEDVVVTNCLFLNNGRSGTANQGGIRRVTFAGNTFRGTSDQDIDFEPTGIRPGPTEVTVIDNVMERTAGNSSFSLTLGGTESKPSSNFVALRNTIGGKVMLFRIFGATFASNTIIVPASNGDRALTIQSTSRDINVFKNHFESTADFVLYCQNATNIFGLTISSNVIRQNGTGRGIRIESINSNLSITRNRVFGLTNSSEGISVAIMSNDGLTRTNYSVTHNRIQHFGLAVRVSTANNSTAFADFDLRYNLWVRNAPSSSAVLFKHANDDDVPASEIITTPTEFCNLCLEL